MKISVSMITLNERDNIERALSSCTFADEIVVVDGGSTDGTLEILKGQPRVRVYVHPWTGHFGDQRQRSLERCTGDWIVRLDADETFSEALERNIRELLASLPPEVVGLIVRQCNLVGDEHHYSKALDQFEAIPRIWRNLPSVRWEGHVHERLVGLEGRLDLWDVYVVHYGFLDKERYWKKGGSYSRIEGSGYGSPEELFFREYEIERRPLRSRVSPHVPPWVESSPGKPRIGIVRGPNLNAWEMQNYVGLQGKFDLAAYTTTNHHYDLSSIPFPVYKLPPAPENPAYMQGLEFALFDRDLIYTADTTWIFSHQAVRIKEKLDKTVVCLQWENIPFAYEEDLRMRALKEEVRSRADHFVAVTQRARDALILEGVEPSRISVIPMGVDIRRFRPDRESGERLRSQLGISKEDRVILFVGRLVWEKGIYDLIHSAGLLCKLWNGEALRWVVAGAGPELEGVQEVLRDLKLEESFIFLQGRPYEDMWQVFNLADVFVLPSTSTRTWREQFGMVLVEAMACGIPVISTYSGSIPEVVGEVGILVPPNDPRSLAESLHGLLRDEPLRTRLSRKGRKRAEQEFNAERVAGRLEELFDRLLRQRRGSSRILHAKCLLEEGVTLWEKGKAEEALAILKEAFDKDPNNSSAAFTLVHAAKDLGRYSLALENALTYLRYHPLDAEMLLLVAQLLLREGRREEAASALDKVLLVRPDMLHARLLRQGIDLSDSREGPDAEGGGIREDAGESISTRCQQRQARSVRVHLGCGDVRKEGYINLDAFDRTAADVLGTVQALPLASNGVDLLESHHVIEHLSFEELRAALREWYRVLDYGGKVLIECPDLVENMRIFLDGDYVKRWLWYRWEYPHGRLAAFYGNQKHQGQFHKNGFDAERLAGLLEEVGFVKVVCRPVEETSEPGENFLLEASKPSEELEGFSLILPTYSASEELDLCLQSLKKNSRLKHELIVIVDRDRSGGIHRGIIEVLNKHRLSLGISYHLNERNLGPYGSWNRGAQMATRPVLGFITDDQYFAPDWDVHLKRHISPERMLTSQLVEPGVIEVWPGNLELDCGDSAQNFDEERFLQCVKRHARDEIREGGFFIPLVIYREVFWGLGGFRTQGTFGQLDDKGNHMCFPNDVEFQQRARRIGLRLYQVRNSFSYHFQGSSWRSSQEQKSSRKKAATG